MANTKTQAEQIQWCGEQVKIAKVQAPERYNEYERLIKTEMNLSKVGALKAAINLSMQINDSLVHLWFMGVAYCLIEEECVVSDK